MVVRLVATVLGLLPVVLWSPSVLADDGAFMGEGYHVFPVANSSIELVEETIVIEDRRNARLMGDFFIEVDMTFRNLGQATEVQMGFPVLLTGDDDDRHEVDTSFRTWVDGEPVTSTRKQSVGSPTLSDLQGPVYTFPVAFRQGETKQLHHSYAVGGSSDAIGRWSLRYVLRTGALWKGPIGEFRLIYKTQVSMLKNTIGFVPREETIEITFDRAELSWYRRDFEPTKDFEVSGGFQRSFMRTRVEEDIIAAHQPPGDIGAWTAAEWRYVKNKVFAAHGYPFKNPFVRAQFYYPGSPYHENASFSWTQMPADHLAHIEWLARQERDAPEWGFPLPE